MREWINLIENALNSVPEQDADLDRMGAIYAERKRVPTVIHRSLEDLPPFLFHGTSLASALDILAGNMMDVSPKGRDKGPRGISFTRDYRVAERFSILSNRGGATLLKKPLPGAIMRFNTQALFEMNHPIVHYKGAYASAEKEERVLGVIQPVVPCIEHIDLDLIGFGGFGNNLSLENITARIEGIIDGTNTLSPNLGKINRDEWVSRLATMKKYWRLFLPNKVNLLSEQVGEIYVSGKDLVKRFGDKSSVVRFRDLPEMAKKSVHHWMMVDGENEEYKKIKYAYLEIPSAQLMEILYDQMNDDPKISKQEWVDDWMNNAGELSKGYRYPKGSIWPVIWGHGFEDGSHRLDRYLEMKLPVIPVVVVLG